MKLLLNTLMALCFITTAAIACPPGGDGDSKAEATTSEAQVQLAKLDLDVVGMTCGGCENKVKAALGSIDGVVETHKVCSESDKASLTFDPEVTTQEKIIAALGEKTGYSVTMITSAGMTDEAAKTVESVETGEVKKECTKAEKAACAKSKASCSKAKASADKELKEEK